MYKKTSLLDGFELPNITHENIKQQLIKLGNSHLVRQRKSIDGLPIEERLKVKSYSDPVKLNFEIGYMENGKFVKMNQKQK